MMKHLINKKNFFNQLKHRTEIECIISDITVCGHLIKNVPVYPDYEGNPSDIVSGDTLSQLAFLIDKNKDIKIIDYNDFF